MSLLVSDFEEPSVVRFKVTSCCSERHSGLLVESYTILFWNHTVNSPNFALKIFDLLFDS